MDRHSQPVLGQAVSKNNHVSLLFRTTGVSAWCVRVRPSNKNNNNNNTNPLLFWGAGISASSGPSPGLTRSLGPWVPPFGGPSQDLRVFSVQVDREHDGLGRLGPWAWVEGAGGAIRHALLPAQSITGPGSGKVSATTNRPHAKPCSDCDSEAQDAPEAARKMLLTCH